MFKFYIKICFIILYSNFAFYQGNMVQLESKSKSR